MQEKYRIEEDVLGEKDVPIDVYWGINTQRAIENFQISGKTFPPSFIIALATVKKACMGANMQLGLMEEKIGKTVLDAAKEIMAEHKHLEQFPVDIFQTGSGTQTNMNMNEVLANRANEILGYPMGKKTPVHPNDHVNLGQSSNDVIPTAMHIVTLQLLRDKLYPAIGNLSDSLKEKMNEFEGIIKVGRTHLQDAVPIPLSMEFSVYLKQIQDIDKRIKDLSADLLFLPIGGTALGTGIGAHEGFTELVLSQINSVTDLPVKSNPMKAEGISSHNKLVMISGVLKSLALALVKMANDIRWMGSGPRAGLGELLLPLNEPGSSIMPGKVNPTQSEMLIQVCLQVIGNDITITTAEAHGSILDLNVTKPLIISNLIESISLLTNGMNSFSKFCLKDLKPNSEGINKQLKRDLMVVTNLSKTIGYDKAGEIALKAFKTGKTIKEVALDSVSNMSEEELDKLLDPKEMV